MNKFRLVSLQILLSICCLCSVMAQNNNSQSPYTRFGFGEVHRKATNALKGMGGISLGIRDASLVNPSNPASYTAVDSMTFIFDLGLSASWSQLKEGENSSSALLGNVNYATLLFPVNRYLSFSAGLLPYSSVGYDYQIKQRVENISGEEFVRAYNGSGNINEVYMGVSVQPLNYWSLGVNGSFLFGSLKYDRYAVSAQESSYTPHFMELLKLKGWGVTAGTQVQIPIGKEDLLTLGFTYTPRIPIRSTNIERITHEKNGGVVVSTIKSDTISSHSTYARPESFGVGISYAAGERVLVGADFTYNKWQHSFAETITDFKGRGQWQAALGTSYTPNARSGRYANQIQYRLGLTGESSYINIRNQAGNYDPYYKAGITLGLGFPLVDKRSYIDLSLGYSRVIPTGQIRLNSGMLDLSISLRFNEAWFKKIRIN